MGGVSNALGLSGKQGSYYSPTSQMATSGLNEMEARQRFGQRGDVQQSLQNYGLGKGSIEDVMHQAQQGGGIGMDEARNQLAMDPLTGSKLATQQVQDNAILGQLYGKGGALERYGAEEQNLAKRGYSMQPEDYEAYGQAAGDISRRSGQQEKALAASLAARGLGGAGSGAAGAAYSGLAGNKMEQLAKMQTDIAQRRMDMNLQRLNAVRSQVAQMGQMGQGAIHDQYGRNLQGVGMKQGQLQGLNAAQNAHNQNQLGMEQLKYQSALNQQANKGATFGQMLGAGIGSSAFNLGANIVPNTEKMIGGASQGQGGGGKAKSGASLMAGGGVGGGGLA